MYRLLLIATDGSEEARRAAGKGLALARTLGGEAVALSVIGVMTGAETVSFVPGAPYHSFNLFEELRRVAQSCVDDVVAEGLRLGVPVKAEVVEGVPAVAIAEVAKKWQADLIVMGTHGRTGLKLLFLGSTAQGVLHGSTVPVLLVR